MAVEVLRIEIKLNDRGEHRLVVTLKDGREAVFGNTPTELGARRMLKVRAKQFGLTVNGDVAQ